MVDQVTAVLIGKGHILNELQEVVERPEETDDVLRLGLHRGSRSLNSLSLSPSLKMSRTIIGSDCRRWSVSTWRWKRETSQPAFPQIAKLVVTDNYASRYGSDRHRVRGAYLHGPVDG